MIRAHSRSGKRSAFTLIEMMVVLLIISILVSLITVVSVKALGKVPEAQTRTEIGELEMALRAFMLDYNLTEPPPSYLILNEAAPLSSPNATFLTQVFGRTLGAQGGVDWNGDGVMNGPWALEGEQCLVFYLGGIPTSPGLGGYSPQGFSTNNLNPGTLGGKRKGPYYTFQVNRLSPLGGAASPFPVYIDAWRVKLNPKPYAYFSSRGINNSGYPLNTTSVGLGPLLDCQTIGAVPYFITGTNPIQYTNGNTYQIISAGKDGVFGAVGWNPISGVPPVPISNANSANQPAGADDQANFSSSLLGFPQS